MYRSDRAPRVDFRGRVQAQGRQAQFLHAGMCLLPRRGPRRASYRQQSCARLPARRRRAAARDWRSPFGRAVEPSAAQAILRILRHGFQHFLDNYPAVTLAGEPEGIHQMRVAVRRLLSAIRMFAPVLRLEDTRGLFQALKTVFTQLGGVREADVFIAETLLPLAAAGLGKTLESVLRREIAAFRAAAYERARTELTSAEFARLVVQLNDWIESKNWLKADRPIDALLVERAAEDFAVPRIRALHAKLLKQGAKALRDARRLASHAHCCEETEICRRAPVPGPGSEDRHRKAVKAAQPAAEFAWAPQ